MSNYCFSAGGRGLALIIFLLSFAWPYTKQIMILGLWFASPTQVSVTRRGSIFLWLDLLGKWSIIDIFVLVIVLVGFQISIQRYAWASWKYCLLTTWPNIELLSVLPAPIWNFFPLIFTQ
jgi:uncharacterized paraquat-inducible protein A